MAIKEKHETFIRQLQEGLPGKPKKKQDVFDFDIQKELERKFEELFGSVDDEDED